MNNEKLQQFFLITLLVGCLVLAFLIFKPFLVTLALAGLFAVVLQPVFKLFLKGLPKWESAAAGLTMLVCLVCILVPLSFLSLQIAREAQQLYTSISSGSGIEYLNSLVLTLQTFVRGHIPGMEDYTAAVPVSADVYAREALSWVSQHLGDAFSSATSIFLNLLVFLFALYYLLRDGRALKQTIIELSPLKDEDDRTIFQRLEQAVNSIIKGNLAIGLLQGIQVGLAFMVFGVPNPVLWGAVASIAALIPGVGTAIVFVPAAIFVFLTGGMVPGLGIVIWYLIGIMVIDNFLGPKLVGHGAQLHPLIVLLAVLGGVAFFGPVGVFLGPLCICLLFAFLSIYSNPAKKTRVS